MNYMKIEHDYEILVGLFQAILESSIYEFDNICPFKLKIAKNLQEKSEKVDRDYKSDYKYLAENDS